MTGQMQSVNSVVNILSSLDERINEGDSHNLKINHKNVIFFYNLKRE